MHKKAAMLEDRGVVSVSGEDATGFLQGLLTNDVERLGPGEARYGALLTPQGKILFDMIAVRAPGEEPSYLIDCAAAQAADLAKRLGFYKLRAKVTIVDQSAGRAVAAFWGEMPPRIDDGLLFADPRDPRLGWRAILPRPVAAAVGLEHVDEYEGLPSPSGRPRAASISPMRTRSRTTPISIFSMGSTSIRAAMSARRSFLA